MVAMIKRQLVFYRWNSIDTQAVFVPDAVFGLLRDKTAGDPEFAVMKHEEITTTITVMNAGSATEPSRLQLLALRKQTTGPRNGGQVSCLVHCLYKTISIRQT